MRLLAALTAALLIATSPADASANGCPLPVDPYGDAGPQTIMWQTHPYTTPLAYELDPRWGDAVDLGNVWLQPSADTLTITMQIRDLDADSQPLHRDRYYDFSWRHPDATKGMPYGTIRYITSVQATHRSGSWTFTAIENEEHRKIPVDGSADPLTNLITWRVPIDRQKSGTKMTELNAYTSQGLQTDLPFLWPVVAGDQSDGYGSSKNYASPNPHIEFDLDTVC